MFRSRSHKSKLSPLSAPFRILDEIYNIAHELPQKKKAQPQGRAFD
jgi:hypothetical protein